MSGNIFENHRLKRVHWRERTVELSCWGLYGIEEDKKRNSSSYLPPFHHWQDLIAGKRQAGLITNWQQRYGLLAAAGPSPALRLWDLASESLRAEMSVSTETFVTALATPPPPDDSSVESPGGGGGSGCEGGGGGGNEAASGGGRRSSGGWGGAGGDVIAAGMEDGTVKLFDARAGKKPTLVFRGHNDWIVNVRFTEVSAWRFFFILSSNIPMVQKSVGNFYEGGGNPRFDLKMPSFRVFAQYDA